MKRKLFILAVISGTFTFSVGAWDYEGHHAINELALASLPKDFGIELTSLQKGRVEFLAGEPDRWRNVADTRKGTGELLFAHVNGPDHYIDLEDIALCGLTPETLPAMRYDFAAILAKERAAHPEIFPAIDPARDFDHTRELDGFLPWAIAENYAKLKSDFSALKALRQYGTPEEIANAQADCIYVMGVMGHYVGDGAQPLHTSRYFNGWVGDNPKGYTTNLAFHSWIDGGYFKKTGGIKVDALAGKIQPAAHIAGADQPDGMFKAAVNYLVEQNKFVEPLYQMEKNGQLTGEGDKGAEGRAFLYGQLVKAGQMLGNIWLTAWLDAPEDVYLERQLQQRAGTNTVVK